MPSGGGIAGRCGGAFRHGLLTASPNGRRRSARRCSSISMGIQVAINHRTSYEYDRRVILSPQSIRLRPAPHRRPGVIEVNPHPAHAWQALVWQSVAEVALHPAGDRTRPKNVSYSGRNRRNLADPSRFRAIAGQFRRAAEFCHGLLGPDGPLRRGARHPARNRDLHFGRTAPRRRGAATPWRRGDRRRPTPRSRAPSGSAAQPRGLRDRPSVPLVSVLGAVHRTDESGAAGRRRAGRTATGAGALTKHPPIPRSPATTTRWWTRTARSDRIGRR